MSNNQGLIALLKTTQVFCCLGTKYCCNKIEFLVFASLMLLTIFILLPIFSAQIKLTVQGLFDLNQDIPAFKEHLRDFMVQIKVSFLIKRVNSMVLGKTDKKTL